MCDILDLAQDKKWKIILDGSIVDCTKGELDSMTEDMLKMMGVFAEI